MLVGEKFNTWLNLNVMKLKLKVFQNLTFCKGGLPVFWSMRQFTFLHLFTSLSFKKRRQTGIFSALNCNCITTTLNSSMYSVQTGVPMREIS